jgi:hypothetical protein
LPQRLRRLSPVSARSQPKAAKLIGVLMLGAPDDDVPNGRLKVFQQALNVLGWTPDKTVRIEVRWVSS